MGQQAARVARAAVAGGACRVRTGQLKFASHITWLLRFYTFPCRARKADRTKWNRPRIVWIIRGHARRNTATPHTQHHHRKVNLQHDRLRATSRERGPGPLAARLCSIIVVQSICKVSITYHMDRKVIIITRRVTFEPTSYCMDRPGGPYGYGPRRRQAAYSGASP